MLSMGKICWSNPQSFKGVCWWDRDLFNQMGQAGSLQRYNISLKFYYPIYYVLKKVWLVIFIFSEIRSISNAFDASEVFINPILTEVEEFKNLWVLNKHLNVVTFDLHDKSVRTFTNSLFQTSIWWACLDNHGT